MVTRLTKAGKHLAAWANLGDSDAGQPWHHDPAFQPIPPALVRCLDDVTNGSH
ncbi:hypothetical protein LN457_15695 [Xanthomonas phaseoli]|uniref:hypothetical protein n=1 Tax=Xanthomonas phaseoli TaxID=1985254 RepID=UPI0003127673|nr:hypothetical protein [Xanthomonas phaseoli]MCC8534222.1 hypothetical protein [Xanthomonas phaseoli]